MDKVVMLVSNACDPDPRVEFEALTISKLYSVKIIAWDRNCKSKQKEEINGIKIERIFIKSNYGSGIKQVFNFMNFYSRALKKLIKYKPRFVHCHDLDTLFIGFVYKTLYKKTKLIYDAHEIYSEMSFKNDILKKFCVSFEKNLLKKVDLFITVGEIRVRWYRKNNYMKVPIIIGNWKKENNELVYKTNIKKEKYEILYIGSLNEERDLVSILNAVSKNSRFNLIIGGNGSQKDLVLEYSNKFDNISYLGFIKDKDIYNELNSKCDVIYYGLYDNHPISKTTVPNKMFEAISFNKVFYSTFLGEILLFNEEYGAFVPKRNLESDLDYLEELLDNSKEVSKIQKLNSYLSKKYNQEVAGNRLIDSYRSLIEEESNEAD